MGREYAEQRSGDTTQRARASPWIQWCSRSHAFPALSLEQVYGAITHHLANRAEIDAYLIRAPLALSPPNPQQAPLGDYSSTLSLPILRKTQRKS